MGAYRRFTLAVVAVALGLIGHGGGLAEGADLRPGAWTFGAGLGFLGGTPDGTAFALNLNANAVPSGVPPRKPRSEDHTSELQSHSDLVCRLLLAKKKQHDPNIRKQRDLMNPPS